MISAADATSELLSIKNYLKSRNHIVSNAILYQDNQACESILKNGVSSAKKMKHIDSKYFFITDYIKEGELVVKWLKTDLMVADYLTKPLIGEKFNLFKNMVLGVTNFPTEEE